VTLAEAIEVFEASRAEAWSSAHTDPDTGWSSALYLAEPGLSIISYFPRMSDRSGDISEPWVRLGHPAAWRGSVRVRAGTTELIEVPGFCVRASARVPEPDSPADRAVEAWKIGLFRLSSLLEYSPQTRAGYGQSQFEDALRQLGITTRSR
jgi:hypothetical protein